MSEVEIDRVVGPLEPVHSEIRSLQTLSGRCLCTGIQWRSDHQKNTVDEEDQVPAGSQEASRLRNPAVGVAPDRGAILADDQIEAGVREPGLLGIPEVEREIESELLHTARGREL